MSGGQENIYCKIQYVREILRNVGERKFVI